MRGFGDNSGLRVLVEVDGQKFNRPDMGSMDWNQLPIGDIESIEVIRGGQTVLYGNHALAGVIKITTKKGGKPRLYLRSVGGSDDFEQYSAHATGGEGNWYADGGVDYIHAPGFRDNSLAWSKTVHASVGRYVGDSGSLTFRAAQGKSYMQFPGPLTEEEMEQDPSQSTNLGDQESWSDNGLYTLLWEADHDWGKTKVGAGYNYRDMKWELGGIYAANKQQGFSLTPRIQFGPEQSFLILGWDFFYDKLNFENYRSDTDSRLNGEADLSRITTGPYAFAQKELTDTLTLSGGVRYEMARTENDYTDYDFTSSSVPPFINHPTFGLIPNPDYDSDMVDQVINETDSYEGTITKDGWAAEISLIWRPEEYLTLWTGYDRSYRYPVLDETAAYQGYPLSDPLNENLDPEMGDGFEAGIKYSDEHTQLSLTGFYQQLNDEIIFDDTQKLNVNIGPTKRLGADLEAGYATESYGLSARGSVITAEFADGENKGKTIPLVPQLHGSITAWVMPIDKIRLSTTYSHVGSQYQGNDFTNEKTKLKPYGLVGARIDLYLINHTTLFAKINNVFDKTYASSAYDEVYYPGAGRSFQLGLTLEF